jgi:putative endonuclease
MFYVYALYSRQFDKIYIGYSSDPEKRLIGHNSDSNSGWTAKYKPWCLIFSECFATKKEALAREKQLKSFRGRKYVRSLIHE